MNPQEELVLKILSSVDVIKGKTKFVKILHLVCKLFETNKMESPFKFKPDKYGVYPPELEPVLEKMQNEKHVQINTALFSRRQDLSAINKNYSGYNKAILAINPKIEALVQALNAYSLDKVLAISYYLFPETVVNSKIKPEINKTIMELFSPLSSDFEEAIDEKIEAEVIESPFKALYPQFNDLDARMHMMRSIGLSELPPIMPDIIDKSTGFLAEKYPLFKKYNLEEMLADARRR